LDTTFSKGREHTHYAGLRRNLQVSHFSLFEMNTKPKPQQLPLFKIVTL
jgi:hypothetical protein